MANLTRTSKGNITEKNYIQENKNNLCKTWQGIKQIILMKKTNDIQLNGLQVNNMIVNDSISTASEFNEFLGSVAKEIDKKIPKFKRTYTEYLQNRNLNPFLPKPVTKSETEKIIMFSKKKPVSPHSIPTNILEEYQKLRLRQNGQKLHGNYKIKIFWEKE